MQYLLNQIIILINQINHLWFQIQLISITDTTESEVVYRNRNTCLFHVVNPQTQHGNICSLVL